MEVGMIGADRDDVQSSKFKNYKGEDGKTDRLGLVFPDEAYANGKKIYCGTKIHFEQKTKKYFICKSTDTDKQICCTTPYSGNKNSWRLGAVVVKYNLVKEDGKTKLKGWEVLPWAFSENVYNKLKKQDGKFPLNKFDIEIEYKKQGQFLNSEITPCNDSIWRKNPELMKKVLALYPAALEDVKGNLAKDLNIEEIKELLGIDTPGSQDAATDVSIGDVLDGV